MLEFWTFLYFLWFYTLIVYWEFTVRPTVFSPAKWRGREDVTADNNYMDLLVVRMLNVRSAGAPPSSLFYRGLVALTFQPQHERRVNCFGQLEACINTCMSPRHWLTLLINSQFVASLCFLPPSVVESVLRRNP
ncbi:hypothetical protein GW17_00004451 [Ensete ventricosum]|nr:hypothetical protein GW17_00004451 [Ensete ventricosum]